MIMNPLYKIEKIIIDWKIPKTIRDINEGWTHGLYAVDKCINNNMTTLPLKG